MLRVQGDRNGSRVSAGRLVASGCAGRQIGGCREGLGWTEDVSRVRN